MKPSAPKASKPAILRELASLRNLGPKSAATLYEFGIRSKQEVLLADAYQLFAELNDFSALPISRNFLRAILGAQQDRHFAEVELKDE